MVRTTPPGRRNPPVLVAVGDLMPGDSAIKVGWGMASLRPGRRFAESLKPAQGLLQGADIVLGNLEAPLCTSGHGKTFWSREQMRGTPQVAEALRDVGFTALSVANNHAEQHGRAAFKQTLHALKGVGIRAVGVRGDAPWSSQPIVIRVRGYRVGILGYCWRPRQYSPEEPSFAEGTLDSARRDVSRLKETCDAVVVSLHWGDEFVERPSAEQVSAAKQLARAGACLIVGHHPHVLQPVEISEDAIIAYSLGNFASDMTWTRQLRIGGGLRCVLGSAGPVRCETFCVDLTSGLQSVPAAGHVPVLSDRDPDVGSYQRAVLASLRRQRRSAYVHAIRNLGRYSPSVLAELIGRTFMNKVGAVVARFGR